MNVIKSLITAKVLVPLQKTSTNTPPPAKNDVQKEYNLDLTKLFKPENPKAVRNFMSEALPVIRYGGSYGMVKSITVASLSDPQLATINILKADEVAGQKESASKRKGLPMIVNPTEVTVEMLGCPLVNFGQSFYIDLGTNTSADNIYACVGISHKISPGDFTTSLKFVMNVGAYGIYNSSKRKIEITTKMLGEEARTLLLQDVDQNKISNLKSGQGDLANMNLRAFKSSPPRTILVRFISNPALKPPDYINATSPSFSDFLSTNPDAICYEVPLINTKNATSPITAKFYNQNVPQGIDVSIDITSIQEEIRLQNLLRNAKKK
jgi:hypothetical protein